MPIATKKDERLLTTQEAASRRKLSAGRIRQWAEAGKIRPVAFAGRSPLYRESDVLAVRVKNGRPFANGK